MLALIAALNLAPYQYMQGGAAALQALVGQLEGSLPQELPLLWSLTAAPVMTDASGGLPTHPDADPAASLQVGNSQVC